MTLAAKPWAWLVDDRWAKAYPLGRELTIGRSPQCMIIIRDVTVSRLHAEVRETEGGYVIRALSGLGVVVNGRHVESECTLEEDSVIEIGLTKLRFSTKAPTNEMFVVPRDTPTLLDRETPTRRTIRAIRPNTLAFGWRRFWRWVTRRFKTD